MTSTTQRSRCPGFTLVELMAVVMVLGIMISVTAANWQKIVPRAQLNSAVRGISDTLNGTRSEAIARNAEFRVLYDLDAQKYWVETPFKKGGGLALQRLPGEEDPEEGRRALAYETTLKDGVRITKVHLDDVDYTDGQVFVRFSPLGASNEHTVELYHEPTKTSYTVEVLALTGLIRFYEGSFERTKVDEGDFE